MVRKIIKNKGGFTLIEVVVSLVLLTVLSIGFLQSMVGFLGITKQTIYHGRATRDYAEKIDRANIPIGTDEDTVNIDLGDGYYIPLYQYTIEGDSTKNEGILRYYKLPQE